MIKLETLLEKHPDDIDSTSGVIIEHANTILLLKKQRVITLYQKDICVKEKHQERQ